MTSQRISSVTSVLVITLLLVGAGERKAAAEGLKLEYEEQRSAFYKRSKDDPGRREESTTSVTVHLGHQHVSVTKGAVTTIYDFAKRRIFTLYPEAKVYTSLPIYKVPVSRANESCNRLMMSRVFSSVGAEEAETLMAPFWVEYEFGLTVGEPTADELKEEVKGGLHRFLRSDVVVAEFRPAEHVLTEPLARMYERFLLYEYPLHPAIQEKVKGAGHVLKSLNYHLLNPGRTLDMTLALKAAAPTDIDSYALPEDMTRGHKPGAEPTEVERIGLKVLNRTHEAPLWSWEQYVKEVQKRIATKKVLEALLLFMEGSLQTGERGPELLRTIDRHKGEDARVGAMMTAIRHSNSERSLATLRSINRSGVQHGYVIDIFIATNTMLLKQVDEAERIYVSVLHHNPYITGVWKDLSGIYLARYKTGLGWLCVDVARSIAPNHHMLRDIAAIEQRMVADHPEFF